MSLWTEMFIPPPDSDKVALARWRIIVSSKLWVLLTFAAWALGMFVYMGFAGFARANDINQIRTDVQMIQVQLLEQDLMTTRRAHCAAMVDVNGPAKIFYAEKMAVLEKRYYMIMGFKWSMPPCEAI